MAPITPSFYALALRVLFHEVGQGEGRADLARAAERACAKLHEHLAELIGSYATRLLMKRAMSRAEAKFPFFEKVEVEADGCFKGMQEGLGTHGIDEVRDGLATMLANFIGLLGEFIGEDMALHFVKLAWPDVVTNEPDTYPER